jgi:LssY C-terminus
MPVHGFLLESPSCPDAATFPIKIPVEGHVVSAHRVGLGLWHETGALEIEFDRLLPANDPPVEIHGRVRQLDNAREQVKKGVIRGIRATDTPQGTISSRLKYMPSIHLYPDPFLLGYKMLFPVFPEAEICLEAGTDLEVELPAATHLPADFAVAPTAATPSSASADADVAENIAPSADAISDQQVAHDLTGLPDRTFTKKGKEADVVNLIFTGSRTDLEMAFATAGWLPSEHISKTTVRHQLYAFLAKTDYSTAPMSSQLLEGHPPDLMLEKTFDSYEKRDHLRIWSLPPDPDGTELWASASVRETGATLSVRHKGFMHHVSPDLAEAQHIIVRDLLAADCIQSVGSIARPDMDHVLLNATGEIFRTDGTLTVVHLKPCGTDYQGAGFSNAPPYHPSNKVYRYARKEILTVRSDLWRANILYAGYDLTRITVQAFHRNALHRADMQSFRQSNSSIVTTSQTHASLQSE